MTRILAMVCLVSGAILAAIYCVPPRITTPLKSEELRPWGGNAYAIDLADKLPGGVVGQFLPVESDSNRLPSASRLALLEDGRPLGPAHRAHAEIASIGGGRFSHWNNNVVLSSSDGTDPRTNGRTYTFEFPLAPPPTLPVALVAVGLFAATRSTSGSRSSANRSSRPSLPRPRVVAWSGPLGFWLAVAIAWTFVNAVFVALVPAPATYPDSYGYLTWSLFRTVGYPALLQAFEAVIGDWSMLPLVQLNLLLAGVAALAVAVATVTSSRALGWLVVAFAVSAGSMMLFASDLLTEAPFTALVMLHLASFIHFLHHGSRKYAAAAGAFLVAAILTKSIAVVLVGPLLLFVIFRASPRRVTSLMVLAPALVCWIAPSLHNGIRHGFFESSIIGGYALAGHVAWSIRPRDGSPDAVLASRIATRLHPELLKRPPAWSSVGEYVDYTAREYNTLLWANAVPELWDASGDACTKEKRGKCTWSHCPFDCEVVINRTLMRLAKETIAAEPMAYVRHVTAHYYGLWRDVLSASFNFVPAARGRADELHDAYDPAKTGYRERLGPFAPFPTVEEAKEREAAIERSPWRRLAELVTLRQPAEWAASLQVRYPAIALLGSLFASAIAFRPRGFSSAALACCYSALLVNAYFLGTALAQPSLHRYAWTMQGVLAAGIVLLAYCIATGLAHRLRHEPASRAADARSKEFS